MSEKNSMDFSTILASSVHDMKNSLNMLIHSLETVIADVDPKNKEQKHHFETLQYQASRINVDLVQLLTLYRNDNGFLHARIDEYNVYDKLEEQLCINESLMSTYEISCEIQCDVDLIWYFDEDLIGSVLNNVLVNCARYAKASIVLRAEIVDQRLLISIIDDGPGYPEEMIVNPGCSAHDAEVQNGNTHLGLLFAQRIAELHKRGDQSGYIAIQNKSVDEGGEFVLSLP